MPAPLCRALAVLALLILVTALPFASPAVAQPPGLSSAPGALEATVALGSVTDLALELRNDGATAVAPRLFEAQGRAMAPSRAVPALTRVSLPRQATRVDPQIAADQATDPTGRAEFLVFLADQADLSAAYEIADWSARGAYVARTLREHAEASQARLRRFIEARGLSYQPLWIVNALAVRGNADDVAALAERAEVALLRANRTAALEGTGQAPAGQTSSSCTPDAANVCWNIARVGASRVWATFGVRGEGITVANIDSGVRYDHPALIGQYRGSSGSTVDHNYHWYDLYGDSAQPVDSGNHGTHTMGTIVGRGLSTTQPAVGMAPGARWIAVRACSARECSEIDLILAAQWLLAPTDLAGNNPRPELRPHVVSNSWTAGQNASWYAGYVAAWRAAGIYPVFAAGNAGNSLGCGTVQSPGDYADVTAVGALDASNRLAIFSSIGPAADGRLKPDLTAPGSGVWSTMADQTRSYGSNSGTSMATPHVAGAVALLWSANPALIGDYEATYEALAGGAAPLTDTRFSGDVYATCQATASPNNVFGYGRLDAYAAVARVTVDVPWLSLSSATLASIAPGGSATVMVTLDARRVPGPGTYEARVLIHGPDLSQEPLSVPVTLRVLASASHATLSGAITRAADGRPLPGTVEVVGGPRVMTDSGGRYQVVLPPADTPYTLTATARDYGARSASVQLGPGAVATLDFALEEDVARLEADTSPRRAALSIGERATIAIPLANGGTKPLTYTVTVANERYGVWRSDEPDGPAATWSDPPTDAVTLDLPDDGASGPIAIGFSFPFADARYDRLSVSANGLISLGDQDISRSSFARACLPLSETPGPAIVALRLDLDPSQDGARVSYARLPEGFLVTWEAVPLYNDAGVRLTFQALLMPDGRISLRYRTPGPIAIDESASAGLQISTREVQSLGCRETLTLSDGLTVELRPQIPATVWMAVDAERGSVAAGATGTLALRARWVPPQAGGWPQSGAVELHTNDPSQPRVRISVRLSTTPAPHQRFFPLVR